VNGDGVLDIVAASAGGIAVFIGHGAGVFNAESVYGTGAANLAILRDLDGDGDLDAAVAGARSVQVMLNDGHGHFSPAGGLGLGTRNLIESIEAGDFDQDGQIDLAVVVAVNNQSSSGVNVYRGTGGSQFSLVGHWGIVPGGAPCKHGQR